MNEVVNAAEGLIPVGLLVIVSGVFAVESTNLLTSVRITVR